jgi:hypothetical protein
MVYAVSINDECLCGGAGCPAPQLGLMISAPVLLYVHEI